MAIFLKAIYRGTVVLLVPNYAQIKVDAKFCLLNPIVLCDIYAFGADAILLLANSIDRLLVVSVPLKYYVHAKYIVLWEILVTHSITISTFAITVFICASNNNDTASIECRKTSYFPESFGARIAWARALLSTTSILTMGAVLLKSRTYGKGNIAFVTDQKLATFKRRQQKFTRLTIASSIVTFALDVVPNCISAYAYLRDPKNTASYITYAQYGSYLNAVNFTVMMSVGHKEIRDEVLKRFHILNEILPRFKKTFNIRTTSAAHQQRHAYNVSVKGASGTSCRTNQQQSAQTALPGTVERGVATIVHPNS